MGWGGGKSERYLSGVVGVINPEGTGGVPPVRFLAGNF